jgi:hypothetical protein
VEKKALDTNQAGIVAILKYLGYATILIGILYGVYSQGPDRTVYFSFSHLFVSSFLGTIFGCIMLGLSEVIYHLRALNQNK